MTHDKATVDRAIARLEAAIALSPSGHVEGNLAALRVLADAVEHWQREYIEACRSLTKRVHQGAEAVRRAEAAEAERDRLQVALDNGDRLLSQCGRETDRLARQVADLEAALEELKQWALGSTTGRVSANGVEIRARAALAKEKA